MVLTSREVSSSAVEARGDLRGAGSVVGVGPIAKQLSGASGVISWPVNTIT